MCRTLWKRKLKRHPVRPDSSLHSSLPRGSGQPASLGRFLHAPISDYINELGTKMLLVFPSVLTAACAEGPSLHSESEPIHRPSGPPGHPCLSGAFPGSAALRGIYWRAHITPVKIIGYAKLRCLDWVSSVWAVRCESQSAPQTPRAVPLRSLDMIAAGLGGGKSWPWVGFKGTQARVGTVGLGS